MRVPFNKPLMFGTEIKNIEQAILSQKLSGEGIFNQRCSDWFKKNINCLDAIMTPSCTAALEMGLMLIGINHGDEVILPSFTFPSAATAISLHGGAPVFVDSHHNLNINEDLIENTITTKTKAIIVMHYGGMSCDMVKIMKIAKKHNLIVLEDAAQCVGSFVNNRHIGSSGHLSAFSFHETKNITCGEGGALCINDQKFLEKAKIARDKGTNRQQFLRGEVDKNTWQDKGSSYLMSELQAAYLLAQLEKITDITNNRLESWNFYHQNLSDLEADSKLLRPATDRSSQHNAHLYYIILPTAEKCDLLKKFLKENNVGAIPHYVMLHDSVGGKKFGRVGSKIEVASNLSTRLLRLPIYYGLTRDEQLHVTNLITNFLH